MLPVAKMSVVRSPSLHKLAQMPAFDSAYSGFILRPRSSCLQWSIMLAFKLSPLGVRPLLQVTSGTQTSLAIQNASI